MPRAIAENIWAGDESSFHLYLEAQEAATKLRASGKWDEDEDEESRLLQVQNGVGVISINGSLNNSSGFFNRLFGTTGYPEIRDAMIQAASDPEIKQILLDINSPGGRADGVSDVSSLIRTINDKVKPVTAFTSGGMNSAAYWLGSSAGNVYADRMGIVGSIGVIATHMERSKQLKDEGIGVTVIRSGKYKALANSVEPLSEEGRKQLQAQVDAAEAVFVEHVATMRSRSVDYTREHMAQGREFVAEDAYRVGLIDGVKTFDALMSDLTAKSIDPSKNFMDNRNNLGVRSKASSSVAEIGESEMKKKALTEQDIALLASGVTLATSTDVEVEAEAEVPAVEDVEVSADAGAEKVADTNEEATEVAAAVETVAKNDDGIRILNEQLRAAQNDLVEAKVEARQVSAKLVELEAVIGPMSQVVAKTVNNMQVALGGSALDLSTVSPSALVAEYARVSEQFANKFKAGGVAAVSSNVVSKKEVFKMDSGLAARINAVRGK